MTKTNKKGVIIIIVFFVATLPLAILTGIFTLKHNLSINSEPKQAVVDFIYSNEEFTEKYGENFKYKFYSSSVINHASGSAHAEIKIKIEKTFYSFELAKTDGKWKVTNYENLGR